MKAITSKKGQVGSMGGTIIALVVAGVFLILGMVILENLRDNSLLYTMAAGCNATDVRSCGEAYAATNTTLVGLSSFANFWEIIVLAIVISIVIGLLLVVFGGRRSR